jgi:CHAD domain-containing protein
MHSNGSHARLASTPEDRCQAVFQRMSRQIGRVSKTATIHSVHKFRTNSRRIEALVSELTPENGNRKKLLRLLSRLRKKAGKVRDLDVQIAFLKELKVPDRQSHRTQLLEWLENEESRRKKKLTASLDKTTVVELRKRLRRARGEMNLVGIDPLELARKRLPDPGNTPLNEKMLHGFRIEAKLSRYLAELAPESPESEHFVNELKSAQDAIGEWHDVLKLKERAEQLFGGVQDSALVAVLQNVSRAKFRRATATLLNAVAALSRAKQPQAKSPFGIERRQATMEGSAA